jgi:hypothetical protein
MKLSGITERFHNEIIWNYLRLPNKLINDMARITYRVYSVIVYDNVIIS